MNSGPFDGVMDAGEALELVTDTASIKDRGRTLEAIYVGVSSALPQLSKATVGRDYHPIWPIRLRMIAL